MYRYSQAQSFTATFVLHKQDGCWLKSRSLAPGSTGKQPGASRMGHADSSLSIIPHPRREKVRKKKGEESPELKKSERIPKIGSWITNRLAAWF